MSADPRFMVSSPDGKPDWWTSDHWATPWPIVRALESDLGTFDLDACCVPDTAKAPRFYTPMEDGLAQRWFGRVWLNPPYSNVTPWLEKAIAETTACRALLVAALLPACVDTRWFHNLVKDRAEIRFIRGRVRFFGWQKTPITQPKTPSIFAIYRCPSP
jgi:phage N-6-adenine-methyltransferase